MWLYFPNPIRLEGAGLLLAFRWKLGCGLFGPFLVTLPAIYICNCKFSYFTGLWNCVLTILHDFQPLYVWGVSAYLSMLIKMLTLGLCVWFPFTIPNPAINLGYYVRPPVAGSGALQLMVLVTRIW